MSTKNRKIDKKRHIFKSITWRLIASSTTFSIAYVVTKDISAGTIVGLFDFIIKMVLYYFHERAWYKLDFGIEHKRKLIKGRYKKKSFQTNSELELYIANFALAIHKEPEDLTKEQIRKAKSIFKELYGNKRN